MLVNLTPHDIVLCAPSGNVTIEREGIVARVQGGRRGLINYAEHDMPVFVEAPGEVVNLPPPLKGVTYIVSGAVLAALPEARWQDVVAPGTGPDDNPIRDEKGNIVAVTCLKCRR